MNKPYSSSSERNKAPILAVLAARLRGPRRVLELGSGTGQHAVYFGAALPELTWMTSDLPDNHAGICSWLDEAGLRNVAPPLALDVRTWPWPVEGMQVDTVYSANTAHIMDWPAVESMFAGVGRLLADSPDPDDAMFLLYGPFSYGSQHTSEGNVAFDRQLRGQPGGMGIRDLDDLVPLARSGGMTLREDIAMPANNRVLVFGPAGHATA